MIRIIGHRSSCAVVVAVIVLGMQPVVHPLRWLVNFDVVGGVPCSTAGQPYAATCDWRNSTKMKKSWTHTEKWHQKAVGLWWCHQLPFLPVTFRAVVFRNVLGLFDPDNTDRGVETPAMWCAVNKDTMIHTRKTITWHFCMIFVKFWPEILSKKHQNVGIPLKKSLSRGEKNMLPLFFWRGNKPADFFFVLFMWLGWVIGEFSGKSVCVSGFHAH